VGIYSLGVNEMFNNHKKTNPLHFFAIFVVSAALVSWMLIDTTPSVQFKHSTKYHPAAVKSLNLDDAYRTKMQAVAKHMSNFCDRGSHIVFAHNVDYKGTLLNDHMFHVCGGRTWINARVVKTGTEQIRCKEEYANMYKSRVRPKQITMRAVSVETWSEHEVEAEGTVSCRWIHAIDILENKWL
jgi:hypothetical protein